MPRRFSTRSLSEGKTYCISPFRWRSIRDPLRDNLRTDPLGILRPFLSQQPKVVLLWDHHGSGAEHLPPAEVEAQVVETLGRAGVSAEDALACAFQPEVEAVLAPVWERVSQAMAEKRGQHAPSNAEILEKARQQFARVAIPDSVNAALQANPKEMFEALLRTLNLRFSSAVFQELGQQLSIPGMKDEPTMHRVLHKLAEWFPPPPPQGPQWPPAY